MTDVQAGTTAIPFRALVQRRLHIGPFESGRTLVTFVSATATGAIVAAATSVLFWLPFLGFGALLAFGRVEDQPLEDYAVTLCRYGLRVGLPETTRRARKGAERAGPRRLHLRARGIPVAYLPPDELHRLFEAWRSALGSLLRPVAIRVGASRFSTTPFLPSAEGGSGPDHEASESYRELVQLLLRARLHRWVDISVGSGAMEDDPQTEGAEGTLTALQSTLERLGIPVDRVFTSSP